VDSSFGALAVGFVVTSAGNIGYHVLSEGVGGASIGKLLLGLRVRHIDLSRPRITGALIRSLTCYLDSIFFGWVAYSAMSRSPMLQRYGDKWGDTVVVRATSLPHDPDARTRLALGLASGIAIEMAAVIASVLLRRVV
jgi:uncharacterized RDD family membrane protein YckC